MIDIPDRNRCDFCSGRNPPWIYPTRSFEVKTVSTPRLQVNSIDEWRACDACHALIQARKWRELAERAKARIPGRGADAPLEIFEQIHQEFRKNWLGPARKQDERPEITCPRCGFKSYNPNDVANRYCANCHVFHEDM